MRGIAGHVGDITFDGLSLARLRQSTAVRWVWPVVTALLGGLCALAPTGVAAARTLDRPAIAIAATPDGHGYWEVASDGGIFGFGNASFFGSMGGKALHAPIVGMAATPDGHGYWEVASDGGIFGFGDASFFGSMGGQHLNAPIAGMTTSPDGHGYWEVAPDGGIFTFGDAVYAGSVPGLPAAGPPRIALYGDSLGMEAGPDFSYLAHAAGASTLMRTYGGLAVCDWLPAMTADARSWQPTAVVLEFSGDAFTPCMSGAAVGTAQYYQKYAADLQAAIDIFRSSGAEVFITGVPYDASAAENQNVTDLDQMYASVAAANVGVTYVDAGQAVMADGAFTWDLPCLPGEPCTGPSGTNVIRDPDGVHFCPTGQTTIEGDLAVCNVYSSGAYRFAAAMLAPALGS